jgi:hypothetical protein
MASWTVFDPWAGNVNPGDQITVSFIPTNSLGVIFPDPNPSEVDSSTFSAFAQTDIPGLSSLFSLSIQMNSATPGQVGISFTSNPLLGLNDAAITSQLESGFTYDSATGDYSFDPTGEEIDATFTVPAGVSSATITTGMEDELDASVPEPSTVALLGLGTLGLLAYEWRRKAKA